MFALMLSPRTPEAEERFEALAEASSGALVPLHRTRSGKAQTIFAESADAVALVLAAARFGWSAGVGLGAASPSGTGAPPVGSGRDVAHSAAPAGSAPASWEGSAVSAAARALEEAQKAPAYAPLSVDGPAEAFASEAEAVLRLLTGIVTSRTEAEWRVLDLLVPGVRGQQKFVAQELGITTQAVSKAIHRSQWADEQSARPAAARILALADGTVRFW